MEITQEAQAVRNIACVLLEAGAPSGAGRFHMVEEGEIHEAVNTAARMWATFHEAITTDQVDMLVRDLESQITTFVAYSN